MFRIDAHHLFLNPDLEDYDWIASDDTILRRSYGPEDVAPHISAHGICGTILIQGAPSVAETERLLELADTVENIRGVVGWVDFENPADRITLRRLALHPKFKGVRPMIQNIPDEHWMLRRDVQWGFEVVTELGLTFDALGTPRHLDAFLILLKRHPGLRTVIDHCMKPQIRHHGPENFRFWADGITQMANETDACLKFSALANEADPDWTVADLQPYADHMLRAFGADRIMWGSDWPVCRQRCEYGDWLAVSEELTAGLTEAERARFFGGTAVEFYGLG